jgi:hypothetical protein
VQDIAAAVIGGGVGRVKAGGLSPQVDVQGEGAFGGVAGTGKLRLRGGLRLRCGAGRQEQQPGGEGGKKTLHWEFLLSMIHEGFVRVHQSNGRRS